jgi:hypothetical protein
MTPRPFPPVLRALLVVLALLSVPLRASAQKDKAPRNAATNCPWCFGDPEVMKAAGIVSHGGFEFGSHDTAWADKFLGGRHIYWIESKHFELGLVLGAHKIGPDEVKKIRAELTELQLVLPEVDPKVRVLEPFMRAHLYAQRVEQLYARFQGLMRVTDASFPNGKTAWVLGTPYFGEGPYLGQQGKFELLILPTAADQVSFLQEQFGLSVKRTQRWNVMTRGSLIVVTNVSENELTSDDKIHGHIAFNLGINLLDAYKHYSYDTPRWLLEGLGHFLEREINPRFNTFDASEGSTGVAVNAQNWDNEVKQIILSGKAPRLAELSALKSYAEFELRHHYACWSMTKFMIETNPEGYACLNDKLHGRKRADDGMPDSEDMPGIQRNAIGECFSMSYPQFDDAWRAWAATQ